MRRVSFLAVVSILLCVGFNSSQTFALATLSLEALANPLTLTVGQPVTFQVRLSGLESGQELDMLAVSVVYDGALLGTPSITPGGIVPDPLADPLDFVVAPEAGLADATFSTDFANTSSAWHICSNDIFYDFDVEALREGAGTLAFKVVYATLFNHSEPESPILLDVTRGPALEFSIIPEPSGWIMLLTAALAVAGRGVQRRGFRLRAAHGGLSFSSNRVS